MVLLQTLLRPAIDFALPPRCPSCGETVTADAQLCGACWNGLQFVTREGCDRCGTPEVDDGLTCGKCLARPPYHDGARAPVLYGDVARALVVRLKHGRRIGNARLMSSQMRRWLAPDADLLVPVPLHRWRLWRRGFNQSVAIGRHLSAASGVALMPDALVRSRQTPILGGLGADARAKALRGAIRANPVRKRLLKGCRVVLVDDVYTSGATANACARALRSAGASSVRVLCFARVAMDDAD